MSSCRKVFTLEELHTCSHPLKHSDFFPICVDMHGEFTHIFHTHCIESHLILCSSLGLHSTPNRVVFKCANNTYNQLSVAIDHSGCTKDI